MGSFGKGFGVGLLIFIVLNFAFSLFISLLTGTINSFFAALTNLGAIGMILFEAITLPPFITLFMLLGNIFSLTGVPSLEAISVGPFSLPAIISSIGFFVIPLITALIVGRLAGGKAAAFGAWFLISVVSCAIIIVILYILEISGMTLSSLTISQVPIFSQIGASFLLLMIILIVVGVINGVFYGSFAMLTSKEDLF